MKEQIGKTQQKMQSLFFLIGILAIIAFAMYINGNDIKSRNRYFNEHGLYTITKITEYSPHTITGSSAFVRISYKVNGKLFHVTSGYNVPFKNGPESGEMFMGIYLPDKPEKCAVMFDYPVKDSADYERYIEEFKKNPPKLK